MVPPEPYEHDTFTLEGHELRIIEQGRTDCPDSTSLHVPSIGLIVAGDVVYNQCRMYVGDTTPESRKNWIAALDRLAALNPAIVVAGHKKTWRARLSLGDPGHQALPAGLRSAAENRDIRPGAVRSDDGAIPALGSQSVVVDVRIPGAITRINRGSWSLRTSEEAADDELSSSQETDSISREENKMTTKGKVLVLVSSGHGLPLKDGKVYAGAGYYLNELTVPVRALMKEGYEITFANPKGNTPQLDVHSAVADFFGGDEARLQDYLKFRDSLTGLKNPTRISDVIASGLDQYDAVFVPGGHGPMIDLLDDPDAGTVMRHFHETSKPTAVLCHGPISLLSALPNSTEVVAALAAGDAAGARAKAQGWIYSGYKMTIFSTAEEQQREPLEIGGKVLFYPDFALRTAGGDVSVVAPWKSYVLQDRELISGQNPFSDEALLKLLLPALNGRRSEGAGASSGGSSLRH